MEEDKGKHHLKMLGDFKFLASIDNYRQDNQAQSNL
jgi:hypothetical protein